MQQSPHNSLSVPPDSGRGELLREFGRFAGAGAVGFVIDAALTLVLTQSGIMDAYLARIPATGIAICATYYLNRRLTFRSGDSRWLAELTRYIGVSFGGAAINYAGYAASLIVWSKAGFAPQTPNIIFCAVAVGSAIALAFNFLGSRAFAFLRRGSAQR
jgi:putative flippase GtrA